MTSIQCKESMLYYLSLQGSYDRARQKLQLAVVTSELAMEAESETPKKKEVSLNEH